MQKMKAHFSKRNLSVPHTGLSSEEWLEGDEGNEMFIVDVRIFFVMRF
jgi:hypothetical protein